MQHLRVVCRGIRFLNSSGRAQAGVNRTASLPSLVLLHHDPSLFWSYCTSFSPCPPSAALPAYHGPRITCVAPNREGICSITKVWQA